MLVKREGCFETNSSSTHAICIPAKQVCTPQHISFGIENFGWSEEEACPENYLYTAILCVYGHDEDELQERLQRLKDVLNNHRISYAFSKPRWSTGRHQRYLLNGSIDHSEDLTDLVVDLLRDEDLLLRYLSGAEIQTGNDNSYDEPASDLYDKRLEEGWDCYWKGN